MILRIMRNMAHVFGALSLLSLHYQFIENNNTWRKRAKLHIELRFTNLVISYDDNIRNHELTYNDIYTHVSEILCEAFDNWATIYENRPT